MHTFRDPTFSPTVSELCVNPTLNSYAVVIGNEYVSDAQPYSNDFLVRVKSKNKRCHTSY